MEKNELILDDGTRGSVVEKLCSKDGVLAYRAYGASGMSLFFLSILFFVIFLFGFVVFSVILYVFYVAIFVEKNFFLLCLSSLFLLCFSPTVVCLLILQSLIFGCHYELSQKMYKFNYGLFHFRFSVAPDFRVIIFSGPFRRGDWQCHVRLYPKSFYILKKEIWFPFTHGYINGSKYSAVEHAEMLRDWILNNSWISPENIIVK